MAAVATVAERSLSETLSRRLSISLERQRETSKVLARLRPLLTVAAAVNAWWGVIYFQINNQREFVTAQFCGCA